MRIETFEATRSILSADQTITPQERSHLISLLKMGGKSEAQNTPKGPIRLLRRKEASERLGISLRTLDLWASEGMLTKRIMPGRKRACGFASDEVEKLISGTC